VFCRDRATSRIPALKPDVAVLDARLPDGNGIDVCRDVRVADASIKGLILTSYEDDEALFAAIMAGASGYVLKQIRGTDLVDAVRRVAAGQSLLDPACRLTTSIGRDPPERRSSFPVVTSVCGAHARVGFGIHRCQAEFQVHGDHLVRAGEHRVEVDTPHPQPTTGE
jgi:DNA-binding response OmpR family regulator